MSSRGQANSSRSKKPRDKKASQVRDHSHDSNRSDTEQSNTRIKSKDDGRRKDASRSRASRSPRKTRDNKEQINIEKASSTRNLLGRKDDVKSRSENAAQDKGRETSKSPVYDRHVLFQDNSRLSQLIGHITSTQEDSTRRLQVAKQLGEYIHEASHFEQIKRNYSNIYTALEDVLKERGHNEIKDQIIIIFGSLGQLLGPECERFFKWVFSKVPTAASDQLRVFYLRSILEAMKLEHGKQTFYNAMPRVMASLQDILENADTPELLLVLMDISRFISSDYPDVFEDYFKDIVDILVGWHIDTTQSESLVKSTSECLIQFHAYWVSDMQFSLTLLSQFIEDMEAYAEELKGIDEEKDKKDDSFSPYKVLPKLSSLVSVFTTVVSCIGDFFIPGRGSPLNASYVNETINRLMQCVDITSSGISYEKLLTSANECLETMVRFLSSHVTTKCHKICAFAIVQLKSKGPLSFTHLRSVLSLIETIIFRVGVAIPVKVIQLLFDSDSPLYTLRTVNDPESYGTLLKIFQSLVSIKNIPIVQTAYNYLVDDLTSSYALLKERSDADAGESEDEEITDAEGERNERKSPSKELERNCKRREMSLSSYEAHCFVIFDLSVIAEIVTYKSSVVGAWKVNPPTFELLTHSVTPLDVNIAVRFPAVQFCIVATLYTHSQRCNHFLHLGNAKGNIVSSEFSKITQIIFHILSHPNSSMDSRSLCAVWLTDILRTVQRVPGDGHKILDTLSQLFDAQVICSYSVERPIVAQAAKCLEAIVQMNNLTGQMLPRTLADNIFHLNDTRKDIQNEFMNVILQFPIDIIAGLYKQQSQSSSIKHTVMSQSQEITCRKDIWLAKKCHMDRSTTVALRSHHFKMIMGRILQGLHSKDDCSWIEEMYNACQRMGKITAQTSGALHTLGRFSSFTDACMPRNAFCSEELLWFWATWESAQFCVLKRLKTPMGKATDTFHSVESVLKNLERKLRSAAANSKSSNDSDASSSNRESIRCGANLRQSILLLQFLENLEKLMYSAFEGSAFSLPLSLRTVRNFFRTNRSACQEWLARIREPSCRLACLVGFPGSAVRHGFAWLKVLKDSGCLHGAEFERAVVVVLNALSQVRAWESVHGILEWCKKVSGRNFFWLKGIASKSQGSLENACEQLQSGLERYLSPDRHHLEQIGEQKQKKILTVLTKEPVIHADAEVTQFLCNQALECYIKLGDWNSVQRWCQNVYETKQRYQNVEGLYTKIDMNYVKAMMKFEENDFPGVREQLELIPGATISTILQEQFPVLGTVKEERDQRSSSNKDRDNLNLLQFREASWLPEELAMKSQLYLLQALTLYWTSGLNTLKGSRTGSLHSTSWQTVEDLLDNAKESLMVAVQNSFLCNYPMNSAPFLMQLKTLASVKQHIFSVDMEEESGTIKMNVSDMQSHLDPDTTDTEVLSEALRMSAYLEFHRSLHRKGWVAQSHDAGNNRSGISSLQVVAARLARKQGNIKLAESLLAKQLLLSEGRGSTDGNLPSNGNAHLRLRQLSTSAHSGKVADPLSAVEILRESAKLKRVLGNSSDAADTLCTGIILAEKQVCTSQKTADVSKLSEISTRSVMTLVQWLLSEPKLLGSAPSDSDDAMVVGAKIRDILKIVVKTGGLSMMLLQNTNSCVVTLPECDKICGQLLHFSTHRCPNLSKTWFAYAEWCYKWGRKSVEHASVSSRIELLENEKESVRSLLPKSAKEGDMQSILSVLSKAHCNRAISPEEDLSATELAENVNEDDEENTRRKLIAALPHLVQDQPSLIMSLLSVWRRVMDRVFFHYKQASAAYFTFLRLGDSQGVAYTEKSMSEYGNITATLRLLRLLVKYSGELKEELEAQLSQTPTRPWKGIIPQLFARLNHPEIYVQNSVANLLGRISKDFPHLIVYPSVVGCSDVIPTQISKTSAEGILKGYKLMDVSEYCDQPEDVGEDTGTEPEDVEDEDVDNEEGNHAEGVNDKVFQGSLHSILDSLSKDNPSLVSEVKTVVKELRRITLLWDELWIGSLMQLNHEAQRRIQQLGEEIQRVNSNQTLSSIQKASLIKEKHAALMKPLVYSLERLEKITSQTPETKHEENFQMHYGSTIQKAIEKLKMPLDSHEPEKNCEPLKQLHSSLHARTSRRSMNCLSMEEISPVLSSGKFSYMPMPGIDFTANQVISLSSFANEVVILPTKTKPKKLVVNGSDGRRYTYLFKGLEDLHLDERITQFLEICNHMFAKEERSPNVKYMARRYSVTPLGSRSGLIQWVDGSTPIFALYKRWQQREIAAQNLAKASQASQQTDKPQHVAPLRPSELFYRKITPLLKEKGISDLTNTRKEWPLPIMKKVFNELSCETPSDLLAKELWCASTNASDWWEATKTYSRSVAVMSMIGYTIGLGDRHLDNILVDLSSGEVVHIDYNVCFEKGKALRVAEKVPFRMTKNIETALGVSGVEGLFRTSCQRVLQILRQGRETLLTLLEAFVYDPLVDWTTGNDGAFAGAFYGGGGAGDDGNKCSKKELERSVTQTLLSTRVAEIRVSWTSNRDELHLVLAKLENCLQVYCTTLEQQEGISRDLCNLQHQHNVLKAALDRADHPLHSLQARYDRQAKLLNELKLIKQQLQGKVDDCKQHSKEYKVAFAKVRGKEMAQMYTEICKQPEIGAPSYEATISFLQSAGQANVITQCDQMESELAAFLKQRRSSLRACLDTLFSYATVVMQFPSDYYSQVWCSKWIPWLEKLMVDSSSDICNLVLKEHDIAIQQRNRSNKESEESIASMESNLQQYFTEQSTKLVKLIERRNQEPNETSVLSGPVTETWNAVRKFIGETGMPGATSLACVTITALTTLKKKYLCMENAAAVSGERLMYLTSQDGDWFLDELCTMSGNIGQLLSVLKNNPLRSKNSSKQETLDHINNCMHVVFAAVKVYTSFQECISNFKTIIVPEALKAIQNGDDTFLSITKALSDLITHSPMALSSIVETLQRFSKEKGTGEIAEARSVVEMIRKNLNTLIEPEETAEEEKGTEAGNAKMTPGQMLLAGFSGLFAKVETEICAFYDAFKKLEPNETFDSIELNQEQKNLRLSKKVANLPLNHALSLLFARRIQVMDGFFTSCAQQAGSCVVASSLAATRDLPSVTSSDTCNGVNSNVGVHGEKECESESENTKVLNVFNEDLLSLPVKQFIAESVQHFVIGLPSHSLTQLILYFVTLLNPNFAKEIKENKKLTTTTDDLCKKAVDNSLKNSSFTIQHLNKASALIHAHGAAWRKHDLARRLELAVAGQKDILQRAQLQLGRFQWLYEEVLYPPGKKHSIPMANLSRSSVLSEIQKSLQGIAQVEFNYTNLLERYSQLQSAIEQRLKWAAGANPALNMVQQNFEKASQNRKFLLLSENKLSPEVTALSNAIVRLEKYRSNTQDAIAYDASIVSIVQKFKECCDALEANTGELGDVEQLMNNLQIPVPPKEPITAEWMKNRLEDAEKKIKALKGKEKHSKTAVSNDKEAVKMQVQSVKSLLTTHSSLVGDVKSLLRRLAKDEEAPECEIVRKFIVSHNRFSEDALIVVKKVFQLCNTSRTEHREESDQNHQNDSADAKDMAEKIRGLISFTSWLHDELLGFRSNLVVDEKRDSEEPQTFASALRNQTSPRSAESHSLATVSAATQENSNGKDGATSPLVLSPNTVLKPTTRALSPKRSFGLARNPRTGKAQQEKNSYAVNVWRRVKAKLEGRDLDLNHRMTVVEQVDHIIREATSVDNLCQLYEGWTPWV